ncbi:MAG: hypothetical protein WCO30_00415 [bacterium]
MKNIIKDKKVVGALVICLVIGLGLGYGLKSVVGGKTVMPGSRASFGTNGGFQQMGGANGGQKVGARQFGNAVNGEVLSLDANSMVVKSRDGGSRIILVSPSVEISKSVAGSLTDLVAGTQVMVAGASNSDGSINATTINIRPASSTWMGR